MKTIIMTIKPVYLGNIRRGKKVYELRKRAPVCDIPYKVLCCESGADGRIVAEFIVDEEKVLFPNEITADPALLDELCLDKFGVNYYLKFEQGHLLHVSDLVDYCSAKGRKVLNVRDFGLERAPQSWCYVKDGDTK